MRASTFVSNYIKAEFLKQHGPRTFTITDVVTETLKVQGTDKTEKKLALVVDDDQRLLLNKVNNTILIGLFGSDETDDWKGKRVTAFFDPSVSFGGKTCGGIRLRESDEEPF